MRSAQNNPVFLLAFLVVSAFSPESWAEPLDFAFGENDSWVFLYKTGNGRYWHWENASTEFVEQLKEATSNRRTLMGVGLDGKAGWVILSEDRGNAYIRANNIYKSVADKIQEIRSQGWYIKDVGLTSDGGYVIIYGQSNSSTNGWTYSNIPQALANELDGLNNNQGSPIGVGITPSGGWALIYTHRNCGKWHFRSQGIPDRAVEYMNNIYPD